MQGTSASWHSVRRGLTPALDVMAQPDSPLIPRIVLAVVAAAGISIPIAVTVKSARELSLLERTGQVTNGTIVGKQCSNHGSISYSYTVNGKTYKDSGFSCGPVCQDVVIGDDLRVIYAGERPSLSRCNSLKHSRANVNGNIVAIIFGCLILSVGIYRVTKPKGTSNTQLDTDASRRSR